MLGLENIRAARQAVAYPFTVVLHKDGATMSWPCLTLGEAENLQRDFASSTERRVILDKSGEVVASYSDEWADTDFVVHTL